MCQLLSLLSTAQDGCFLIFSPPWLTTTKILALRKCNSNLLNPLNAELNPICYWLAL